MNFKHGRQALCIGLRQMNSGQRVRKMERADCRNRFWARSNVLQSGCAELDMQVQELVFNRH